MTVKIKYLAGIIAGLLTLTASCSKSESYSDLLRSEEKAVNWYLSNHKVATEVPSDSVFLTGEDAPFYRLNDDGTVYMQVINPGDPKQKVSAGDKVYFFYSRQNIRNLWELGASTIDTNEMSGSLAKFFFLYGDTSVGQGKNFGAGIQLPLSYLGYYSEVNLVLKSYSGFPSDQSDCIPYIVNVKYLKPEY